MKTTGFTQSLVVFAQCVSIIGFLLGQLPATHAAECKPLLSWMNDITLGLDGFYQAREQMCANIQCGWQQQ